MPSQTNNNAVGEQQENNGPDFAKDFDPTKDIDLSHIQIIDTSKGDSIDFNTTAYNQVYSFRCLNCMFKYEGNIMLDKCPRCGSDRIDDSQ